MKLLLRYALGLFIVTVSCCAADVPAQPLAAKGKLLVSDDFERTSLGDWKAVIPTFTVTNGVLVGSQTRDDHGSVGSVKAAFKDGVIEFKFRLEGSTGFNAVCDDKTFKGTHAGHICRVAVAPKQIRLADDKEGAMRNDIFEMRRDPKRKAAGDKLLVGRSAAAPVQVEQHRWYRLCIEIVGDAMRVSLDDKPLAYLKSPGLAHPTKSDFHFTVNGKDAHFDEVRIYAADQPAK
ncbi:MAG: hypothetical protein NTY53_07530 [Kiritimatiellaeota bacterium]|nr:hypothetical protein [Kiritimatiellota bacterium]